MPPGLAASGLGVCVCVRKGSGFPSLAESARLSDTRQPRPDRSRAALKLSGDLAGVSPPHRGFRAQVSAAVACPRRVRSSFVAQRSVTGEGTHPWALPQPCTLERERDCCSVRGPSGSSNLPPASLRGGGSDAGPPPRARAAGRGRRTEPPREDGSQGVPALL